MKKPIRILIADDHAIVRVGLETMLNAQHGLSVVGQAKNGREAVQRAEELRPDVVVMDLRMPTMDGIAATAELAIRVPAARVLILTTFGTSDGIAQALEAGAAGALMKTAEDKELVDTIRRIAAGETVVSAEIKRLIRSDPPLPQLSERRRRSYRRCLRASPARKSPSCSVCRRIVSTNMSTPFW